MKLLLPILLCALSLIFTVKAQAQCGTASKLVPENSEGILELASIRENIARAPFEKQLGDTLIFPTVVHIIHYGPVGNITDSQVYDGLRIINEDFNRENPDTSATRDIFKPHAAAVGFKFVLAKLDSNGDSTSAIVRIDTSITPHPEPTSSDFDNCKYLSQWPADMYYNIWIVPTIQGGAIGYAQYPGTNFTYGGPWHTWGIVVTHSAWGTIGTSNSDGRTGTHEVGHTFGLYHTFLSTSSNCGSVCDTTGDEVCDTPPCTYSGGCSQTVNQCSNDTVGPSAFDVDSVDQIENYMSYNTCQNMFSQGQQTRMRGFIAEFPTLTGLSKDSNLLATGIIDEIPISIEDQANDFNSIVMYPNPFDGIVNVRVDIKTEIRLEDIQVINLLGQQVAFNLESNSTHSGTQNFTLQLETELSGVYFMTLISEKGVLVQKLIKE